MRDQKWTPGSAAVLDTIVRRGGPGISAEARLVYLALFSYMGTDYTSRPSVATLAEGTGLSGRTVQRVLKELEAGFLVSREPRFDTEGRRTSTLYHMAPPWAIARPVQDQKGEGDSLTPPPDPQTPPGVREAPASDSVPQGQRPGDTSTPSGSHPPGDSVTPKVTHSEVTQLEVTQGEEGGDIGKAPLAQLHSEAITWRKWYEAKFAGRFPRSESASVLDNAAAGGMSAEVIIRALEQGLTERARDPLSWAAYMVGNMVAAGIRTMADAEEYERERQQRPQDGRQGSAKKGVKSHVFRADSPRSKWEVQ